jgi:hypothetical protein
MTTLPPASSSVIDELIRFVDVNTTMKRFFKPKDYTDFSELAKRFLRSTMDQVRVNAALECTRSILKVSDLDDLEMFREGVWKREAGGVIKFPGQRDHTAHTLNNWLLGWYLYDGLPAIREAMDAAINRRKWARADFSAEMFFGHAWLFASLLHDIGYLFEGALDAIAPGYQNDHAAIGLRTANEYFQFSFWKHMRVDAVDDRTVVLDEKQSIPEAPADPSMTQIAMYLRTLDRDMTPLYAQAKKKVAKELLPGGAFSSDAFELWKAHFEAVGEVSMVKRISSLEEAFIEHATRELPGTGVRVLDHGTCSGLLQLKIATFFYRLFASLEDRLEKPDLGEPAKRTIQKLLKREDQLDHSFDFEFWWSGIVWATASCALHNLQQQNKWPIGHAPGPLTLKEDPLAYLGILVDSLQDWDRYLVFHSRTKVPIQGIDVNLHVKNGKAVIEFAPEQKKRVAKLREELDNALVDWKDLVQLLP